ncbi:MAG: hypothetical protein Q9178_003804 [Gyalolechia marmorata]
MLLKGSIPLLAIISSLVQALEAVKPRAPPIILENLQQEDDGNWRNNAQNRKENQLQWSEIMYQTWKLAANMPVAEGEDHSPGGPISNLRAVVQSLVTNAGTLAILRNAYEANDWVPRRDREWREWTEPSTRDFFCALLGTDNVKGTVWLLKDHRGGDWEERHIV